MASIEYTVRATDLASAVFGKIALSADGLDKQLEDLGKRVAEPEVDLKDAAFTQGMIRAAERIDKLSAKMATPGVDLEDPKFQAEIIKINAQLDRLDKRHVTATVSVDVDQSRLTRVLAGISAPARGVRDLFPGGGGGAGGILRGLGGLFGGGGGGGGGAGALGAGGGVTALTGIGGAASPAAIGVGVAAAASLAPAVIPTALGVGLGGLGAFLAAPKQLAAAFKSAFAQIKTDVAPLRPLFVSVFSGITGFARSIGPGLRDVFAESVPFLRTFVSLLEQSARILLPAFSQSLRQMRPFLPQIAQGLLAIVKGLAGMINAMGPGGMKAATQVFVALCKAIEFSLIAVGKTANFLAEVVRDTGLKIRQRVADWRMTFDDFRHNTAVIFDGIRHDIAAAWDAIWSNTIGRIRSGDADASRLFDVLLHNISDIFDHLRHDIAAAWDTIWNNTVARVRNGINDVIHWFETLPGRVVHALFGLGHSLYAIGHSVLTEFWNGIKSVAGSIFSWVKNFIGSAAGGFGLIGIFHKLLHIGSPSQVFFDIGKNMMLGLEKGIKATAQRAVAATTGVAHQVAAAGSGVQRWAGLVRKALSMEGLSQGLAGNVLFQMQTESGGNPNAINLTDSNAAAGDPSRGLMQTIMSTFQSYHWPGTSENIYDPLANIAAALNYARHVYGPTLMSGGMGIGSGHGYAGGTSSAMAGWAWVGERGPELVRFRGGEQVVPAGQSRGRGVNVTLEIKTGAGANAMDRAIVDVIQKYVIVHGGDTQAALGQRA